VWPPGGKVGGRMGWVGGVKGGGGADRTPGGLAAAKLSSASCTEKLQTWMR
jgi:hypothetical protein